jgi:hypothetical protein
MRVCCTVCGYWSGTDPVLVHSQIVYEETKTTQTTRPLHMYVVGYAVLYI